VSWLYGQTWLYYLIAFVIGLLLARLVLVRPQERRLKALLLRSAAANRTSRPTEAGAAGTGASVPVTSPAPAEPTEPVRDQAAVESPADAATDVFPAVNPALSTLDATLVVAEADTPPAGLAVVPPVDDTATPPDGIPVATEERPDDDLIPDEPAPDRATGRAVATDAVTTDAVTTDAVTTDAPTTARLRREKPSSEQPASGEAPEAR